jgi:Arc/MetJ family transcription regulator
MTHMTGSPKAGSIPWQDRPLLTIEQTSVLLGGSTSRTYGLLVSGELEAVKLAGKTLVRTPSVTALIERDAKGWKPDRKRVEKAVSGRPDVARKRARAAS